LFGDGVRLSPDIRGAFRKLVKKGFSVTSIAGLFGTTRQTVYRWLRRGRHRGTEPSKTSPESLKKAKSQLKLSCPSSK